MVVRARKKRGSKNIVGVFIWMHEIRIENVILVTLVERRWRMTSINAASRAFFSHGKETRKMNGLGKENWDKKE
jgi:hypothetical protein